MNIFMDMDTAPKTGEDILLLYDNCIHEGRWIWKFPTIPNNPEGWYWAGYNGAVGPIYPTKWCKIPEYSAIIFDNTPND